MSNETRLLHSAVPSLLQHRRYSTVKPADIYSKCKGRFIPAFSKNALI